MLLCIIIGLLPFAVGGWFNSYILSNNPLPLHWYTDLGALFVWFLLALLLRFFVKGTKKVVIGMNLVAFVVLLLIGIQELILNRYWMNEIGRWTQYYYLPFIRLGFILTTWTPNMFFTYLASFLSMILSSAAGCWVKNKGVHFITSKINLKRM